MGLKIYAAFGVAASLLMAAPAQAENADILLVGGAIIDGTGKSPRRADLAIKGERIVAVGKNLKMDALQTLDISGLMVSPGAIDLHNHSEYAFGSVEGANLSEKTLRQCVTTIVIGPDGSYDPERLRGIFTTVDKIGSGVNVAFFVGHNGIRENVMGDRQNRAPLKDELTQMAALADEGMKMGAVGLATGLMYSPGVFSETDEVIALAKMAAPYGGVYSSHVRDPHSALLQSNWEAIEIGRQAGVPVNLTHLTTPGKHHRGLMKAVIEQVEDANRDGVRVTADQYPYPAVATVKLWDVLSFPEGVSVSSLADVRALLRNPEERARLRHETVTGGADGFSHYKASGASSLYILDCPGCEQYEMRFISEVAADENIDGFEAVAELLMEAQGDVIISVGGFYEEDMVDLLKQPWAMVASDAYPKFDEASVVHPRAFGTFPRIFGKYVREDGVLSLGEAVRKMTSAPADFTGLKERGRIEEGAYADLCVFDADAIADRSTWAEPMLMPVGVEHVLVNGAFAIRDGEATGDPHGVIVKRELKTSPVPAPHKKRKK
ncbi:amidohydrolase family protein [Marinicaulis aureus]|uniref:Amidohydrolase family protein n=1 Tax=Hyphococcus aureus TaxID=2666033 RepID=A0ABW1KZY0_9PROT